MSVSEETILNERLSAIKMQFSEWLRKVRLNADERDEIESVVDELETLSRYK